MTHPLLEICPAPLEGRLAELRTSLAHPGAGGFATFEGWVRDSSEGRPVRSLEYEAYAELAGAEGARIVGSVLRAHGCLGARCLHRVGHLAVGELAVWVGVCAPHRGEAFDACRAIIDQVKHRVPIWKKEHYTDGDSGWVRCEHCAAAGAGAGGGHAHTRGNRPATPPAAGGTGGG